MIALETQDTRALQAYLGHKNIQHTVRYTELSRRNSGTSGMTSVVNLRRPHRKVRDQFVALDKVSGATRYFEKVVREIETDLGGKRILSRIKRPVRIV